MIERTSACCALESFTVISSRRLYYSFNTRLSSSKQTSFGIYSSVVIYSWMPVKMCQKKNFYRNTFAFEKVEYNIKIHVQLRNWD